MAPSLFRKTSLPLPHGPTDYGRYRCERITDPFRFRVIAADWGRLHELSGGSVFSHHELLMAKIETSIEKRGVAIMPTVSFGCAGDVPHRSPACARYPDPARTRCTSGLATNVVVAKDDDCDDGDYDADFEHF